MKFLMLAFALLLFTATGFSQKHHPKNKRSKKLTVALTRYQDNVHKQMKDANGDPVYIGASKPKNSISNKKTK